MSGPAVRAPGPVATTPHPPPLNTYPPPPTPLGPAIALPAILALALVLRLWAIDWQLPWAFHPDEGHYVWKAVDMVRDGNLNPKYFRNPSLYTYILAVEDKLLDLGGIGAEGGGSWPELLQPPSLYLLLGRLTSALLGTATVLLVYRLGQDLVGRAGGLLGALLLAVSFLHVRDSHFATNDVPATFFLTISVLFSARVGRDGRGRDVLLAGLFGGLATSTKYNAGFFVVPLLAAYLWFHRRRALAPRPALTMLGAGLLAVAAYLAGTPFTILAWPSFRADFLVQQRFSREGWEGQGPEPPAWLYLDALGSGLGWVALGLAAVGFALLARRRPLAALVLGGYPLAYLLFMFGVKLFFARFALTLLPFLALAAGYGAVQLAAGVPARPARAVLLGALALAAVAQPLQSDLRHNLILAQPDTRILAYTWLEQNVPPGTRIVAEEYSVRDRRPRGDLADRGRFDLDVVNALGEQPLAAYVQGGYAYAVLSSFEYQRFPGRADTYAQLERQGRLLASFAPTADGRELPFDIEALYSPYRGLDRYERPGPTIKIYALPAQ